jgi:hypothetical protein
MAREIIDMQLTPDERSLLLRYGYPFERIERALRACAVSPNIEILIGDVCRSINQMDGGVTQDQLLDLCDRLEAVERQGDGMLDVL